LAYEADFEIPLSSVNKITALVHLICTLAPSGTRYMEDLECARCSHPPPSFVAWAWIRKWPSLQTAGCPV
jgi:hypothetical protein